MPPPQQVLDWLATNYPKPRVDPEWLNACYDWVITEQNLDPTTQVDKVIKEVEHQLLESDLRDSMLHGTGLPTHIADTHTGKAKLKGPVLVEITAITEIGTSAYNLNKTRIIREERLEAGEQEEGEGDNEVEGEGPIPLYPRSMLSFVITDGALELKAMEYKPIPEFVLGSTQLGCKLLLHNVLVRRGIAFLEPSCITIKGHKTPELEVNQKVDFARSLRQRLGLPEPAPPPEPASPPQQNQHLPLPLPPQDPIPPPVPERPRSPLREISTPPSPTLVNNGHGDDEQPRRRRVPTQTQTQRQTQTRDTSSTSTSPFFERGSSSTVAPSPTIDLDLRDSLPLSPTIRRTEPIVIESDEESDDESRNKLISPLRKPPPAPSAKGKGKASTVAISDEDDEFADEIDYDDDFLAQMDEAESKALVGEFGSMSASRESAREEDGCIVIDSDEDDKENVPAPTRHVRRKTARKEVVSSGEVIDISD